MTREIKFRGKRLDNGEWVYGDLIQAQSGATSIIANLSPFESDNDFRIVRGRILGVNPDTIGQYTGLKDGNGKDIYEGDVVKHVFEDDIIIGEVVWWTEVCGLCIRIKDEMYGLSSYCWVIGNIYDNPELLED